MGKKYQFSLIFKDRTEIHYAHSNCVAHELRRKLIQNAPDKPIEVTPITKVLGSTLPMNMIIKLPSFKKGERRW